MLVGGFIKNTFVDFPGKVASSIFLSGCNYTCGFCHNPLLVQGIDKSQQISLSEVFDYLKHASSRGFLDGVCVTGGEPTIHGEQLRELINDIKKLGLAVKLDTNGSRPDFVATLNIDYVAMDLKTSIERYPELTKVPHISEKILESIELLHSKKFGYEFRTTMVPTLVEVDDINNIGKHLLKEDKWYFQNFRNDTVLDPFYCLQKPFDMDKQELIVKTAAQYAKAELR